MEAIQEIRPSSPSTVPLTEDMHPQLASPVASPPSPLLIITQPEPSQPVPLEVSAVVTPVPATRVSF